MKPGRPNGDKKRNADSKDKRNVRLFLLQWSIVMVIGIQKGYGGGL